MLIAISIALLSLILIYLEFFVPGIILGVLGGFAFCISIFLFIWESGDFLKNVIFIIILIILLTLTIKLALRQLKQKPTMFAREAQSGYLASEFDKNLVEKRGKAVTDLKPSGYILVEGERYQAVSESRYIKKGENVKIIGGEGARFIVRKT